ncbi:Zeta toxin [Lysobacter sp. yr284]|uniref:zeta toxin family protein n=1 Tax=Lysobacter sp. yr284 TaxID=1761791 RepID=UPI00089B8C24|nr:zeta toxin family protein [Lysobacter sp. yr284]SDY23026.1 Zeta toxin [Lysobacter sp. yr284]
MSAVMFDSERNKKIYQAEILPSKHLEGLKSHDVPTAIILAGQPGAGKGGVARLSLNDLGKDALIIDLDELRDHFPGVNKLRRDHPYTWADATHRDAQEWTTQLRNDAIAGRKNVIIDATLGNGNRAVELIDNLKQSGYRVEVRAVAAHKLESELGVDQRFSSSLDKNGFGRYVPQDVRDAVYAKLPANLDQVHAQAKVPVCVYSRDAELVYDSRHGGRTPGEALAAAREARLADPRIAEGQHKGWHDSAAWHGALPKQLQEPAHPAHSSAAALLTQRAALKIEAGVANNADFAAANLARLHAPAQARPEPLPMPAAGAPAHSPPAAASSTQSPPAAGAAHSPPAAASSTQPPPTAAGAAHSPPATASSTPSPPPAAAANTPAPTAHTPPASAAAHSSPAAASSSGPPAPQAAGRPEPILPTHPQYPVYQALRGQLPDRIGNDKVLELAVRASTTGGIRDPGDIDKVMVSNGNIFVSGRTPGQLATVGETTPSPAPDVLLQQSAAFHEGQQNPQAQGPSQHPPTAAKL